MKNYILYIFILAFLSFSIQSLKAESDFDDWDFFEEIEESQFPSTTQSSNIFKPIPNSDDNTTSANASEDSKLVVTICYDDPDKGYYCKDLP